MYSFLLILASLRATYRFITASRASSSSSASSGLRLLVEKYLAIPMGICGAGDVTFSYTERSRIAQSLLE